jgi:hypothetical protein
VPEAVVVALESVEVEHHQEGRARVAPVETVLEIEHELAPVVETGQCIGDRLLPRQVEEPLVLSEGRGEPQHNHEERRAGEHDREDVQAREVVVDEDPDADERAHRGHGEEWLPLHLEAPGLRLRNPGRGGDEQRRNGPEDVDELTCLVGAHLEEVDRVCDRGREETEPQNEPLAIDPPARQ